MKLVREIPCKTAVKKSCFERLGSTQKTHMKDVINLGRAHAVSLINVSRLFKRHKTELLQQNSSLKDTHAGNDLVCKYVNVPSWWDSASTQHKFERNELK